MSHLWRRRTNGRRKVENRAVFCWTRNHKTAGLVNRYISGESCHSLLSLITLNHCGVLSEINIPSQPRTSCSRACSGRLHFHQCVGYTFGFTFLHFVFGWTGPQPSIIGGNCSAQFRIHTWIYRWMTSGDISRNLLSVFTPNYDWKVSPCENGGITSLKMSRISFYWNIHKATIFSAVCTWKFDTISVLDTVVEEVLWRRCPIGILLSSVLSLALLCFWTDPCQIESCQGLSTYLPRDNR